MGRQIGGWMAAGLLVLTLTACGTPQPADGSAAPGPAAQVTVDDGLAEAGPATPPPETTDDPTSATLLPAPAAPEAALAALPSAALPGPGRLMGLSGDEIKALLGTPGFVRRDPPAEIWQYGTNACVLDLFLYAAEKGGPHRVSHFEFRGRSVTGVAPAECYRQLLADRPHDTAG